ncbi:hypothetical protein H0H93_002660, partial [Arthromyces matolae]
TSGKELQGAWTSVEQALGLQLLRFGLTVRGWVLRRLSLLSNNDPPLCQAPAIDMRHYDTVPHGLDLAYEDVGDPNPDPTGVGRSYEAVLQLFPATPSRTVLANFANVQGPWPDSSLLQTKVPQIIANPSFYAEHKLFGGR